MSAPVTTVDHSLENRSKVTNGSKMFIGLDGRSSEVRRYRDLCLSFADDLGGLPGLTEAQRALVRQASAMIVQSEKLQAAMLNDATIDVEQLTRLANISTRILTRLGIKRRAGPGPPSLAGYLAASKARPA